MPSKPFLWRSAKMIQGSDSLWIFCGDDSSINFILCNFSVRTLQYLKSFKQIDLYCSGVLFQARNYLLSNKLYDGNIILAVNEWSFSGYFRQIGTYNLHLRKHVHKQNRMAGTALLALAFRSYWKLPIFNFSNSIPVNWADMEILPNLLSWKIRKRWKDIK